MATRIDTPDTAYSTQTVTLNKVSYQLKFKYSARFDRWSISLYSRKGEPILVEERAIPRQEFLRPNDKISLLQGYLFIDSLSDTPITRDNFGLGKEHNLVYISEAELAEAEE